MKPQRQVACWCFNATHTTSPNKHDLQLVCGISVRYSGGVRIHHPRKTPEYYLVQSPAQSDPPA